MNHFLNLDISDTLTCATLRVTDASVYVTGFPVENAVLEVTHPGTDCPIIFSDILRDFNLILNANNLHIMANDNNQSVSLPDGVYKFRYSINPNLSTFVEVYWFRTCKIMSSYRKKVQDLFLKKEDIVNSVFDKKTEELLQISFEIQAAKFFAEDRKDFKKASQLYNSANEKLGKLSNSCLTC
jgi:hypothetical protein